MAPLSLVFLLPACLLLSQVTSRAVNISTTWTLPQEGFPHFFRYFKDPTTWDDAKVICGSYHAELLTVENDERRDAARAYLKELDVLENVWCGLQRSTIEAPFVWTGGGQDSLADDAFWQEPHPLEPERLCVSISPLHDFRWQSFPCSGPQQGSFVCQLEVPKWADQCLINSLPSLTVTYLPELGVIELLSDCGLSGTKRIACKGAEKTDDLTARLSCDRDEEQHTSTQTYSSKHNHGSSESSTTRSFNTRHKRQSGATSTSTDTSVFATEPQVKIDRIPAPEPMSPVDVITMVAEYAKEDQIEETTVSVIDQVKDTLPPIQSTSHNNALEQQSATIDTSRLTVKNWLAAINDALSSTELPITTILPTASPIISTNAEYTRTKIEIPPTAVTPEQTTIIASVEKDSRMPHPPYIQFREKATKLPTTTTEKTTTTTEEFQESGLVFTDEDLDTNATENNILSKDEIFPAEKFQIIVKSTETPKTETVPETSATTLEDQSTETIPAQTSDAVPETARPATINATNEVTQAEPKNTVTETATKTHESTTVKREPALKLLEPLSEDSTIEAENPKRSTRGRLFPHSNPLSFYPYFLTKVLG